MYPKKTDDLIHKLLEIQNWQLAKAHLTVLLNTWDEDRYFVIQEEIKKFIKFMDDVYA